MIILEREGGIWKGTVPFSEDGEYIVELYAEDWAGNIGYYCTVLFAITRHSFVASVVPRGYEGEKKERGFDGDMKKQAFYIEPKKVRFGSEIKGRTFSSKVKERGYGIERIVCIKTTEHGYR